MSTEPATTEANAFVRIDPAVRDRLRQHCQAEGLVMGRYVSNIITRALDNADNPPAPAEEPARFLGRRAPRKPRRKALGKSRRKAKAKK